MMTNNYIKTMMFWSWHPQPIYTSALTQRSVINRLGKLTKRFPHENDPERFVSCLQENENKRKFRESVIDYKSSYGGLGGEKCERTAVRKPVVH